MKKHIAYMDRLLQNRFLSHTVFWMAVLLAAPMLTEFALDETLEAFIVRAVGLPLKILATYVLVYYQIPAFFQKGKYFQFILSLLLSIYVFCILYRINNIYIAETLAGYSVYKEPIGQILQETFLTIIIYLPRVYGVSFVFLFIKMVKNRAEERNQLDLLQKEKAMTELNFLKAQIHPHFLFNTLNNLYALTLDKSDKAPEVVEKLSNMLDYILYKGSEDMVTLSTEINLIKNFIDLEKLRYGDRLDLSFEKEVEDDQVIISPLVLLSVVENAFKHGASGALKHPRIEIVLEVAGNELFFKVYNTKAPIPISESRIKNGGIGTRNIKRQLELIYPNRYSWQVNEDEDFYEVQLQIAL